MIHRTLDIGRWWVDFFFASAQSDYDEGGDETPYDEAAIIDCMRDMGAPTYIIRKAWHKMEAGLPNEGFTYSNPLKLRSIIVIGQSSSGSEFLDSFVHELRHLANDLGWYLGIDLRSEPLAYLSGDAARELADVVCALGCPHCRY